MNSMCMLLYEANQSSILSFALHKKFCAAVFVDVKIDAHDLKNCNNLKNDKKYFGVHDFLL